jgi:hypothetical protein
MIDRGRWSRANDRMMPNDAPNSATVTDRRYKIVPKIHHRLIGASVSNCPTMPESNDTPKAIAIIVVALGVLGLLLLFANHIRPHP